MEAFSGLLAFAEGNLPVRGALPSQMPVARALMFSLMTNDWANNRDAGDLRGQSPPRHYPPRTLPTRTFPTIIHRFRIKVFTINIPSTTRMTPRFFNKPVCFHFWWFHLSNCHSIRTNPGWIRTFTAKSVSAFTKQPCCISWHISFIKSLIYLSLKYFILIPIKPL